MEIVASAKVNLKAAIEVVPLGLSSQDVNPPLRLLALCVSCLCSCHI